MTRLPDRRKENDKHRDKPNKGDSLVHLVHSPGDLTRRNRLQPLPPSKSTRLPPLKSQGHPVLENRHVSGIVPPLPVTKQDFEPFPMGNSLTERNGAEVVSKHLTTIESDRLQDNNIHAIAKGKHMALDDVQTKVTDAVDSDKCKVKFNKSKPTDRIRPHPPPPIKDSTTTSKPFCTCKRSENDKDSLWLKEKELLRKHRKQQAERRDMSTKPLKATMVFNSSGKEVQNRDQEQGKATKMSSLTQRKRIDLSVNRKCDDDDDWDWDKDIDDFLKIEEKERTRRYTISGTGGNIEHGNNCEKSPVIFNCTKKGVGFKSKRKIEEEKRQEQERIEKERKEIERRELMLPQKIRKDLKKYGFR